MGVFLTIFIKLIRYSVKKQSDNYRIILIAQLSFFNERKKNMKLFHAYLFSNSIFGNSIYILRNSNSIKYLIFILFIQY